MHDVYLHQYEYSFDMALWCSVLPPFGKLSLGLSVSMLGMPGYLILEQQRQNAPLLQEDPGLIAVMIDQLRPSSSSMVIYLPPFICF